MDTQFPTARIIREAGAGALGRIVCDLADIAVVVGGDGIVLDVPHVRDRAEQLEPGGWCGRPFADTMAASSRPAAGDLLERLRGGATTGGQEIVHAGAGTGAMSIRYGGTALEGGDTILLVGRAVQPAPEAMDFGALFSADPAAGRSNDQAILGDLLRHGTDLVVLIDDAGRLLWANDAFNVAAEISHLTGVVGRFLVDLVDGQGSGAFEAAIASAVSSGAGGPVAARLRGDAGGEMPVSVGFTRVPRTDPPIVGAIIRPLPGETRATPVQAGLPAFAGLLDQAGQVPMKGLVRETADLVERHCVLAALKLTGNNRSAAARTLGISRQALYQKLERFGLLED